MNDQSISEAKPERARFLRQFALLVPGIVFAILALLLGWGLTTVSRDVPSNLIGRPVPQFDLPPIEGRKLGLATRDLIAKVSLVNVFASWCTACRLEHPIFMRLAKEGRFPIYGLNYKDQADHALAWLAELGDPYTRIGADLNGRVAIDWGVYGVPETYVVGHDGIIAYKHIGPISEDVLKNKIFPLVARLQARQGLAQ